MRLKLLVAAVVACLATSSTAWAQVSDAALKDRVLQLVERLDAPKMEARQAAEDGLIKLGPRVLPLLPEAGKSVGAERNQRLDRIRAALREAQDQANISGPTRITIKSKGIRLTEAVQKLQAQSSNLITDLREQSGAEASNPALDLEIVDKPFFEALDELAAKAEVTPNYYTGDGSIGLMAGKPPEKGLVRYVGPFRVSFKQIAAVRDFQTDTSTANAQLEVAWEPHLRPMLLSLKADEMEIKDDQGKAIEPRVMNESNEVVLRPENPVVEVNVGLAAPDRAARMLATLKIKAEISAPAGVRTFRFKSLKLPDDSRKPGEIGVTQKQGDISVTLADTEIDEQVWKVNVTLAYPGEGPAFESYRQGLFNNRLWLQKADGSRFEHNGGFSNTSSDGGKLGFEYLFVDVPGKPSDYGLVYETPSNVVTIPLEVEFKDVPLP
jgi:hypothetical protein